MVSSTAQDYSTQIRYFTERGFLVIPSALSAAQIAALNHAIDSDLERHGNDWVQFNEALTQTPDILSRTAEFDFTVENPVVLNFLRQLIGEDVTFEEFLVMIREPTKRPQDFKRWHRDLIRDYDRRMEIEYLSVIYYLTDVGPHDHCFSIVPETHARLVDLRPEEITPGSEIDVTGPAGTAVIFHGRAIHAGKHKPQSRQRRTVHVSYWSAGKPRAQEWTPIPRRLYERTDPTLPPLLYSKYAVTEVVDGVGRRPPDLDPSLPVADIIREVHRRANRRL
jgi:ectoine hydroxylase-related dioxygenase (phytanoyl-CoA dioxygenase family)